MRQLQAVEAILDEAPADARARLDSIDASALQGESRALYAMLKTQADYKCYVDITSDSLIREATTYYGTRRKSWRAAMSWYSLGCVLMDTNEDVGAADAYLNALPLFPDTLNRYYAICQHNIGEVYLYAGLYPQALSYLTKSLHGLQECGDSASLSICKYNIATTYLYDKQYDKSDSILRDLTGRGVSQTMASDIDLQLAKIQLYSKSDYDSAVYYAKRSIKEASGENNGAQYNVLGVAYYSKEMYDSARLCFEKSLASQANLQTICDDHKWLAELYGMTGDASISSEHTGEFSRILYDIYEQYHQSSLAESLIEHEESLVKQQERVRKVRYFVVCIIILTVLAALLYVFYIRKVRKVRLAYKKEFENSVEQLRITKLYGLRQMLDDGRTSFHAGPATIIISRIVDEERESSFKEKGILEEELKHHYNRFIAELVEKARSLNSLEINYSILYSAGYSNKVCSQLLHTDQSHLRVLKTRLRTKMPEELYKVLFSITANS